MKKTLLFILLIVFSLKGYSQQLTWTPIADYPHVSFWPAYFMLGNDLYVSGGLTNLSPMVGTNDLQKYDPTTNTWSTKSSLPAGFNLNGASSFTINGMGYIVNGQIMSGPYNSSLWQYDPGADSWTSKAPFTGEANYTAISFCIGQYGFLGLGFMPYTNNFYRYDSQADSWSPIDPFPGQARQGASSFVINGTAYVGMGGYQNGSSFVNLSDFYKYDTSTGNWSQVASYPDIPRIDCQSFALNGKGYIVAGMGPVSTDLTSAVWEYDPQTDTWTQAGNFPVAFRSGMGCSNGSNAIVGLGLNVPQHLTDQLWETNVQPISTPLSVTDPNIPTVWFYNNIAYIRFQRPLSDNYNFDLYDLSGRKVTNAMLQTGETSFDISLAPQADGAYFYNVNSSDASKTYKGKMVVTH